MASEVGICNRALQKLGAKRIVSLTEDSRNARECNACYTDLRDAELQAHPWVFATFLAQLAASGTTPLFGRARSFPLPTDYLAVRCPYPEDNSLALDWVIQNGSVYTDDSAPLDFRYTARITDPNDMDSLFREALAARIAMELCESITQSNTKMDQLQKSYSHWISEARRNNAIIQVPAEAGTDPWITARA